MKTAILILAAGSSSRMGKPKQLLPYKNTTLLGNAIEQAKNSKADAIFCVLGANAKIIEKEIEKSNSKIINNPNFKNGLSSSIVIGVNYLTKKKYDSVLIILADQPNITAKYLDEMLALSKEHPTKIIVSNYGEKFGVPAIFPKQYFQQLLNLKGDKGAKDLLNNQSSNLIVIKNTINLIDIDTEEEYQNLIE